MPEAAARLHDADDRHSAVDPDCCLRGVDGQRGIDASVMPLDRFTNPNVTTIMIAETTAARLREQRRD